LNRLDDTPGMKTEPLGTDDIEPDYDFVVALCPNCHRRVHEGRDGDAFNDRLIERVRERRP
jgi:predicted HNH restriction endonuclease